jgi:hypothetical protein
VKMLNTTILAQIVAGDRFTGLRCKRDGMSKPGDTMLIYQAGGRRYAVAYQRFTGFMSDGSEWEIWFAPIEEEQIVFYKNAKELQS